jgi:hypothetical protein
MSEARSNAPFEVLSVVIPALNEELAIGDTLRRCIAAQETIKERTGLKQIEFLIVSDGSTDRTEEIARSFADVTVLSFDVNRGYGAAIKCGFEHAQGDLLGFLDADGTCDPEFFAELVTTAHREEADIVLGSRMSTGSKMPWIRTFGNRLFAWLLSAFSLQSVVDTASGMRVIRRAALDDLYPLPDGLHFTPAMSARALMEGKLKLVERPMPYSERTGRSKLRVLHDGVRFLSIIVRAAVTFRPARPLLMLAALCAFLSLASGLQPTVFYLSHFRLEEWVIYRVLMSSLLATIAGLVLCAAVIADRIAAVAHGRWAASQAATSLHLLFARTPRTICQLVLFGSAFAVVMPGLLEYLQTSHVQMHWSRAVLGSLLIVAGVMLGLTGFLLRMMDYIEFTKDKRMFIRPPERVRLSRNSKSLAAHRTSDFGPAT